MCDGFLEPESVGRIRTEVRSPASRWMDHLLPNLSRSALRHRLVAHSCSCSDTGRPAGGLPLQVKRLDGRYEASEIWVGADSAVGAQLVKPGAQLER